MARNISPVQARDMEPEIEMGLLGTNLNNQHWRVEPLPPGRIDTFETEGKQKGLPQLERPTFVPVLSTLRRICMERSQGRLRALEARINGCVNGQERSDLIDEAIDELRNLDRQFDAITDQHQPEDPGYAKQRGLALVHFSLNDGAKKGDWMLVSGSTGKHSTSTTERDTSKLSSTSQKWLEEFCGLGSKPPAIAFKRHKTMLEQQRGVFVEEGRQVTMKPVIKRIWAVVLALGCFAQICFLGVGIIAMTSTLNKPMIRYMYWVCFLWIIWSSSFVVILVRALGASGKDCLAAFLAAVAIWLVVVQIGQTKLNGQLGEGQ